MNPKITELQNRIIGFFRSQKPIKASNGYSAEIQNVRVRLPEGLDSIKKQTEMKYGRGSLMGTVTGQLVIKDKTGNVVSKGGNINLLQFPLYTQRNTVIIDGIEKVIMNQMRLKPGSYSKKKSSQGKVETQIKFDQSGHSDYVPNMTVMYDPTKGDVSVQVGGNKASNRFDAVTFMREIGFSDTEISATLGRGELADKMFAKASKNKKSLSDIYRSFFGKLPPDSMTPDAMKKELLAYFKEKAVFGKGQDSIGITLGVSGQPSTYLSKPVIQRAIAKTFSVGAGLEEEDPKDDIQFKEVLTDIDIILEQIKKDYQVFEEKISQELNSGKEINARTLRPVLNFGKQLKDFLSKSTLMQPLSEDANPLLLESFQRKITQTGDKWSPTGITRAEGDLVSVRNLTTSGMNKIDPVETPESQEIGMVQHLSGGAKIKDGQILLKVFPVRNGTFSLDQKNVKEIGPSEEKNSVVAFFDVRYVSIKKNSASFTRPQVPARLNGEIKMFPANQVKYIDSAPNNILGTAAAMIPFVSHDDGARALMGSNMQKQAVGLVKREKPMVASIYDPSTGETYEDKVGKEYGKPIIAPVNGVISKIADGKIYIKDSNNKTHALQYYNYYPMNGTFINNEIKVKKGDTVKSGQMLAEGWQTKDGSLALGKNVRVAFLPYKGYNYEDGIVISQSLAKEMESEEVKEYTVDFPDDCKGGPGSKIRDEVMMYTSNPNIKSLGEDGVIKEGSVVGPGSVIAAYLRPIKQDETSIFSIIKAADRNLRYRHVIESIPANSYVEGKVVRKIVVDSPDAKISKRVILTISHTKPLSVGDKLAGRHGNKGTITRILPDKLMPFGEDGKRADLLFSPLAVPSRKNVGQLFETNAGLIAEKTGRPYHINNFNPSEKDRIFKDLQKIGLPDGKMKMYYMEEVGNKLRKVPIERKATTGNMYIMKLRHKVDDKIQSRSNMETPLDMRTNEPRKQTGTHQGEKHNPQSLGEMEFRSLVGHGAAYNILESATLKSDGGGNVAQRAALFKALQSPGKAVDPRDLDFSSTPGSLKLFADELKGLGLNIKPSWKGKAVKSLDETFDALTLLPIKSDEIVKKIGESNRVVNASFLRPTAKGDDFKKREGSLYDPKIFGDDDNPEDAKNKWGYIKLATPILNPMFVSSNENVGNIYSVITGMKKGEIASLMEGKSVIIVDPDKYKGFDNLPRAIKKEYVDKAKKTHAEHGLVSGALVPPEQISKITKDGGIVTWRAGGNAMLDILSSIDVKKEARKAARKVKSGKSKDLNAAYGEYRVFKNLADNGYEAKDLLMTALPVVPIHVRPTSVSKGKVIDSDLNKLYHSVIRTNNAVENVLGNAPSEDLAGVPAEEAARRTAALYKRVSEFMGVIDAKDKNGDVIRGIKDTLTQKEGLVRGRMLKKRQDFSARSVIGVDPNLKINEVALPLDIAKTIYKPFVIKELVRQGYAKNSYEALDRWEKSDYSVKKVLRTIAEDRPVLLNRQPSLHKYSIQALKPVIKETQDGEIVRNIQLNPFVVTGLNADFDGDQAAIHVPITEKAKEEAWRLMTPTASLINPKGGKMLLEVRHEMALGVFYITSAEPVKKNKTLVFNRYDDLYDAYMLAKVSAGQIISTPIAKNVTVGKALFNWCIPEKYKQYRDFSSPWDSKKISAMLTKIYAEEEKSGWKKSSETEIGNILDRIKQLGFNASTRAGVSIGTKDFLKIENTEKIFNVNLKNALKGEPDPEAARLKAIVQTQDQLEKRIRTDLPKENPLRVMMDSGARGNAQQIRRMTSMVGMSVDVTKRARPNTSIMSSHFDGLSPQDYFELGYDSRKGIYDRSASTAPAGALSRDLWHMTQELTVKENDCGTRDFVSIKKSDPTVRGRYASENIIGKNGNVLCARNVLINDDIRKNIDKDESISYIRVRSPMRCKTPRGVCQKCYGALPGTLTPIKVGTSAGTLATQALGEPLMQSTMNTFHTGGSNSAATQGLPRLTRVLNLGADNNEAAVLAKCNGTVTEIKDGAKVSTVVIGKTKHVIPANFDGSKKDLRVKVGDTVRQGDFLTVGNTDDIIANLYENAGSRLTYARPADLLKGLRSSSGEREAVRKMQDYLGASMQQAVQSTMGAGTVDRRHTELVARKLISSAEVVDPGNSPYVAGQMVDRNVLDAWNRQNVFSKRGTVVPIEASYDIIGRVSPEDIRGKGGPVIRKGEVFDASHIQKLTALRIKRVTVLPKQIIYKTVLTGKSSAATASNPENWFSNVATEDVMKHLRSGAAQGKTDTLSDVRSQIMAGKLPAIGEAFNEKSSFRNSISNRMRNFFAKTK